MAGSTKRPDASRGFMAMWRRLTSLVQSLIAESVPFAVAIAERHRRSSSHRAPSRIARQGERSAARHLRRQGCRIIARNVLGAGGRGEIDLIMLDTGVLVFVEVKTRCSDRCGGAREAVTRPKRLRLVRLAKQYIERHRMESYPVRFDIVAVLLPDGQKESVEWIQDAFDAQGNIR